MSSDVRVLLLVALARVVLQAASSGQYGFHRDELVLLDDARFLAWGYVAYPPLTPAVARLALDLFGPSLVGLRLFSGIAQGLVTLVAGLTARELGGGRGAQVFAALAVTIAPISLMMGSLFEYVSFDYLWWVLAGYCLVRLFKSDDPRWWLALGAVIGLGLMTRYTMLVCAAGIAGGVLLSGARRHLATPWPWVGAVVALLICLPTLLWQAQHDFIAVEFTQTIHARDVRIGRTAGFLTEQLIVGASPLTIPLWLAGLWFYLFYRADPAGRRYRAVGWLFVLAFGLFLVTQARSYYLAPAYPMLLAGGAVFGERLLGWLQGRYRSVAGWVGWGSLAAGGVVSAALFLPVAPINSGLWNVTSSLHDNFVEQVGWPELVATVAGVYASLPPDERAQTAILTGNYGEAGAVNLYGGASGLPEAISGVNSYWLRGYGSPPPQTVIVLGLRADVAERLFERCEQAARITNRYGVKNEESAAHPDVLVCRGPRQPWPELWPALRSFG